MAAHQLISAEDRVLVGFSGGADSTCLLHLLWRAKVDVVAAMLHHGQRPEADEELERGARLCEELGVPFAAGRANVPAMAVSLGIGIEEAGRRARYGFFDETAARTQCSAIATAHTRTDHAETVLLNLARGSGLSGLSGIPVRRGQIVRPLLFASRNETVAYCRENGLDFFEDPANEDLSYSRARIRHRVTPELQTVNPAFEANVARLAEIVEEEDRFLDAAAAAALERAEIPLNGELRFLTLDVEARLDRETLRHFPPVLLKRAIRLVGGAVGARLDYSLTQQIFDGLSNSEKGSATSEVGAATFTWTKSHLHVAASEADDDFRAPMKVPGEVWDEELGWRIEAAVEEGRGPTYRRDALEVWLDVDGFRGPLHIRPFQPGDTMRPMGGTGSRKLGDLMTDAKLTLLARRRLPIICDIIGPIWAPGVAVDERVRVAPGSARSLRMQFSSARRIANSTETEGRKETYANW